MSRHSKWHKVRQFKGAIDAKRAASFTKLAHEITVAVKEKGSDMSINVRLKVAVERAKKASMTKDTIERAIQRGLGGSDEAQVESLMYEAYGPGGTAMIVECVTDSRNRATNDVKLWVTKASGTLATQGAVTYLFDRIGTVTVTGKINDDITMALIDAGATDIVENEESIDIRCAPNDLSKIADAAQKYGLTIESAEFEWLPKVTVDLDEEKGNELAALVEALEASDDVSHVYTNAS